MGETVFISKYALSDGIRDIQGVKKHVYPAKSEWRDVPVVET